MADMPSSRTPPRRPRPSSSRAGRHSGGFGVDSDYGYREEEREREKPRGSERARDEGRGRGASGGMNEGERERGTSPGFAASKEEFTFDDEDEEQREGGDDDEEVDRGDPRLDYGYGQDGKADFYAILNVPKDATTSQLRSSYHQLSLYFHPDKQPPHLRAQATAQFNLVKKAYDTLIDPKKRVVYDKLGEEGLQVQWDIGTKLMTPAEFKVWLEERVKRGRRERTERLVGSTGVIILNLDGRRLFGNHETQQGEIEGLSEALGGAPIPSRLSTSSLSMTRYFIQHSFHLPLPLLQKCLDTPLSPQSLLPSFLTKHASSEEDEDEDGPAALSQQLSAPVLRVSSSLGGGRVLAMAQGKDGKQKPIANSPLLAQAGLEFQLGHVFPSNPVTTTKRTSSKTPKPAGPSISQIMAGSQIAISHAVFTRSTTLAFTRPILNQRIGMNVTSQIVHGSKQMPTVETTFSRSITRTGTFFMVFASGSRWNLKLPFGLAEWGAIHKGAFGNGSSKIGFTSRAGHGGIDDVEDEEDDEEDFEEEYQDPSANRDEKLPLRRNRQTGNQAIIVALTASQLGNGFSIIGLGFDWARTFFASSTPLPQPAMPGGQFSQVQQIPNSAKGIRVSFKTGINMAGSLSCSLSGTRPVGEFSRVGVELSLGGSEGGLVWGFTFRRLGQKITIPVLVSKFIEPEDVVYNGWVLAGKIATGCLLGYAFWEFGIVRRREERERRARTKMRKGELKRRLERESIEAEGLVELMREGVSRRQRAERESGGLVVLHASYGAKESHRYHKSPKNGPTGGGRIDVTIPVAALVDNGQLVIPSKISKSQIIGIYDPVPYQPKTLEITYLFRGVEHKVEVSDTKGVVCPLRGHAVGGVVY